MASNAGFPSALRVAAPASADSSGLNPAATLTKIRNSRNVLSWIGRRIRRCSNHALKNAFDTSLSIDVTMNHCGVPS